MNTFKSFVVSVATLFIIWTGTALALEPSQFEEYCSMQQTTAYKVMEARQANVPIINLLKITEGEDSTQNRLIKIYIRAAYNSRLELTDEFKLEAANRFSNDVYLQCIQSLENGYNNRNQQDKQQVKKIS